MYYIYELVDPRDGSVFYVGKGKGGRIDQHEVEARKGRQSRKCDKIREIEAAGGKIIKRKVSKHTCEVEAYEAEIERISLYGLSNLTNVSGGGGAGVKNRVPTVYEDRVLVAHISKMFQRLRGQAPASIKVSPDFELDVSWVPDYMRRTIGRVVERRSADWVNEIAAKYNVEYTAPAQ